MTDWKVKVEIGPILDKYDCEVEGSLQTVAKELEDLLNKCDFFSNFYPSKPFLLCKNEGQFDKILSELYDYADATKIWLGI